MFLQEQSMGKVCPKISLYEARRAARLPPVTHSSGLPRLGAKRKREPRATTRSAPRGPPPPAGARRPPPGPAAPRRRRRRLSGGRCPPGVAPAPQTDTAGRAGRGHRSLPPPPRVTKPRRGQAVGTAAAPRLRGSRAARAFP